MFSGDFRRNVVVTRGFFLIRLLVSVAISVLYIFVAAGIQYWFVQVLGESVFNYVVGGLLSLLLGIVVCKVLGSLFFMFVKGWHVAALAYVPKIVKAKVSAVDVGICAFKKNLVSFGAVYGVRTLLKSVIKEFKSKLWDILGDVPYGAMLRNFAQHPVVEYISSDILHYAFDATVFYLVRHSPKDLDNVPGTLMVAAKKYFCCLPAILVSSVQTYVAFRFVPKILKWILILYVFLTQGMVAGVLIIVLMFPVFYILENTLLDPLTMMVFITAYSRECEKELDENSAICKAVESTLSGEYEEHVKENVETTAACLGEEADIEDEADHIISRDTSSKRTASAITASILEDLPEDDGLGFGTPVGASQSALNDLASLIDSVNQMEAPRVVTHCEDLSFDHPTGTEQPEEEQQFIPASRPSLSQLFGGINSSELQQDIFGGLYSEEEGGSGDLAQEMLMGDD